MGERFMTLNLPDGSIYSVRTEQSGIVFEAPNVPVDRETAVRIMAFKMWKFGLLPAVGRA